MIESWEWAEVAETMLGLEEGTDEDVIESAMLDEFGINMGTFSAVASKLLTLTVPTRTALGGQLVQAFVVNDEHGTRAIVKQEYTK